LILGINGSGKSVFLEVLRGLRDFAVVGYKADEVFTSETLTRWQTLPRQTFELEVTGNGGTYTYTLWVEVQDDEHHSRVLKEALDFNEKPLLLVLEDQVQLFDDTHVKKATYPFESDRSALTVLGPRKASHKLAWFKEWLNKLYCLSIDPSRMGAEGKEEDDYPEDHLENFAAWYGHIIQEQTGSFLNLQKALRESIEGFDSLDLKRVGRKARVLRAAFSRPSGDTDGSRKRQRLEFDFDELSDGERTLIALYTLLYCAVGPDTTVCLDEPDNFLALSEIQPWLFEVWDRVEEVGAQTILISHHPEAIDLLANDCGVVFSRTGLGPIRVEPYRPDALGKLSPSERIARGWERD
jgi:energy-coupling factor transporter ATP-binding protein EcfA2